MNTNYSAHKNLDPQYIDKNNLCGIKVGQY